MEAQQELEWNESQKIGISVDLESVAKQQLRFLAAVDRNRHLYEGPALQRAIYRYNACWLPLLAKYSESRIFEGPLVVPLDCEWVWHCHRLNPVRYKSDCEQLYGRILDNFDVVSTVQGICGRQTEEIWNKMYPDEPYNADLINVSSEDISERTVGLAKYTKYDLVSAAKRQSPFFYQVSRPHMNSDVFIKEAVARYKGFLYLIKRNKEKGIKRFCVPTYDIDLIWHSHQLYPVSYCKDLNEALGKVLEHDDMDSDRTKGKKLDVGFSGTTKQWEETFGTRYWKAGAMYRGNAPSPVTSNPSFSMICEKVLSSKEHSQEIQLQERKVVEVLLELVGVKNLPEGHKGSLFVVFSKSQPDVFFDAKRKLSIFSESGEKQVASFQCEPTGELHFELMSHSSSNLSIRSSKTMGSASFSMQDYLDPISKLSIKKWLELVPKSGTMSLEPILLQVAISFTLPAPAPYMLEMTQSRSFSKNSCFFNFPVRHQHSKSWTHVTDETGTRIISLQLRDLKKGKDTWIPGKEVIGLMKSGETRTLAEFVGNGWSVMDNLWFFHLPNKCRDDGHLFEVTGTKMAAWVSLAAHKIVEDEYMKKVKIFPGRKLEYEPRYCGKQGNEMDFLTAVEFSKEDPYGKAVALLDLGSGFVKAKEKWMVLPGIILGFIASNILKKEGYEGIIAKSKDLKTDSIPEKVNIPHEESQKTDMTHSTITNGVELSSDVTGVDARIAEETKLSSGGCGGGCGSGCGGGYGRMTKSSGCGGCGAGGCGAGCGNIIKSGGCGGCGASGCGAGCGNIIKSGGCGGCGAGGCGGGCGNIIKSGGCGGCGAGGCGAMLDINCGVNNEVQVEKTNHVNEAVAA
ncbi:Glycine-rich domain-containing protein 1 [Senna tora]|uniref:Glycine-rich domain-containing protein 1 n=1 Tax=Senna tora TaxID=362788 RepID=A0A834WA31_9FABA|nr:Glycine-rich domain-containing protein 1 [Senna tora]